MCEVSRVLAEIGAAGVPQVLVFNKLDAIENDHLPHQLQDTMELDGIQMDRFFVSAKTGVGLAGLRQHLASLAYKDPTVAGHADYGLEEAEAAVRLGTIEP